MKLVSLDDCLLTYRVSAAPLRDNALAEYGIDSEPDTNKKITELAAAYDNIDWVFENYSHKSRFSDGSYPVLYCSQEKSTARSEKGYWVERSVFGKNNRPKSFSGIEYEFEIAGKYVDCCCDENFNKEYVNPDTDQYDFCIEKAKHIKGLGATFIKTYSARKYLGINCPVFNENAVGDVKSSSDIEIFDSNSKIFFRNDDGVEEIVIDEAYRRH